MPGTLAGFLNPSFLRHIGLQAHGAKIVKFDTTTK
jgi:hypothetical protein